MQLSRVTINRLADVIDGLMRTNPDDRIDAKAAYEMVAEIEKEMKTLGEGVEVIPGGLLGQFEYVPSEDSDDDSDPDTDYGFHQDTIDSDRDEHHKLEHDPKHNSEQDAGSNKHSDNNASSDQDKGAQIDSGKCSPSDRCEQLEQTVHATQSKQPTGREIVSVPEASGEGEIEAETEQNDHNSDHDKSKGLAES